MRTAVYSNLDRTAASSSADAKETAATLRKAKQQVDQLRGPRLNIDDDPALTVEERLVPRGGVHRRVVGVDVTALDEVALELDRLAPLVGRERRDELAALVSAYGFELERLARHDEDLDALLTRVEARLRPLGIGLELLAAARRAARDGALG